MGGLPWVRKRKRPGPDVRDGARSWARGMRSVAAGACAIAGGLVELRSEFHDAAGTPCSLGVQASAAAWICVLSPIGVSPAAKAVSIASAIAAFFVFARADA